MHIGKSLAVSAMMGMLTAAACGGPPSDAKAPSTDPTPTGTADKHQCGNHDGGSCGAKDHETKK